MEKVLVGDVEVKGDVDVKDLETRVLRCRPNGGVMGFRLQA